MIATSRNQKAKEKQEWESIVVTALVSDVLLSIPTSNKKDNETDVGQQIRFQTRLAQDFKEKNGEQKEILLTT